MARTFQLRKIRSFVQKLEDSFEFIRITAKTLFKSLLFFTGPFVLVGGYLVSNVLSLAFNLGANAGAAVPSEQDFLAIGFSAIGFMFLMLFAGAMIMAVVYAVFRLYEQNGNADFSTSDVWTKVKEIYWTVFGTVFLYGIAFFFLYLIIVIPLGLLTVFLSILIIPVVYVLLGFFLSIMLTAIPSQLFSRKGLGDAFSHALKLLKGRWWSSLGLLILLMLIYNVVTLIFAVPFYISLIFSFINVTELDLMKDTPIWVELVNYGMGVVLLMGSYLCYAIPLSGMTIQYFSLAEEKEGTDLMSRIETFGETETEEEGDY